MELVLMPQLGISEDSAILTVWHINVGGAVKAGDKLFSIETGKSTFDVESEHTGTVLALLASEGDEVAVKAPVCAIGQAGETVDIASLKPKECEKTAVIPVQRKATESSERLTPTGGAGVSPRARRLAEKNDIDPKLATPTGPDGRIIERDVRLLLVEGCDAPTIGYEDKPLSHMRKVIAKNMMASLQNTAQLTHTASFDATALMEYRKVLKGNAETAGITLTDMILYAVTRTLPDFTALNAWLLGDTMRCFREVHLACAVDTEKGLMVPVLFGASQKSLLDISRELKQLAQDCRNGTIAPELLTGGSFTVSNLGQFGIESFTPILNAPQTGILGVNTITYRVKQDGTPYPCMALSLTYDHRAIDGAPASRFLQALCNTLEDFTCTM